SSIFNMKLFTFALLLVIAGASASQDVDGGYRNRLADLVMKDFIERLVDTMVRRGYDPYSNEHYKFEIVLVERKAEASGHLNQVEGVGVSNIKVIKMKYNYLFGILEYDVVWPHIKLSLGKSIINYLSRSVLNKTEIV
ncbi:jg12360, partial [Pararge aegeria aegeria]